MRVLSYQPPKMLPKHGKRCADLQEFAARDQFSQRYVTASAAWNTQLAFACMFLLW